MMFSYLKAYVYILLDCGYLSMTKAVTDIKYKVRLVLSVRFNQSKIRRFRMLSEKLFVWWHSIRYLPNVVDLNPFCAQNSPST